MLDLRPGPGANPGQSRAAAARRDVPLAETRSGWCWPKTSSRPGTSRRSPTAAWTAMPCGPPTSRGRAGTPRLAARRRAKSPPERSSLPALAPGTALRIMTGAPLPPGRTRSCRWKTRKAARRDGVALIQDAGRGRASCVRQARGGRGGGERSWSRRTASCGPPRSGCAPPWAARRCASIPARASRSSAPAMNWSSRAGRCSRGRSTTPTPTPWPRRWRRRAGVVTQRLHARDTPDALREAFDACAGADVLLTSGGVSVGDYDYVKAVFAERGTVDFWRVAIRPGKPLAFGALGRDALFRPARQPRLVHGDV